MKKNLIAAGHRATAEAAAEIIDRGGTAFDAAIAGVFAAMIAESTLTSAGGGGYLLAAPANGSTPILFDFFVDMPRGPLLEESDFAPVGVDFGTATQEFFVGKAAAAVPGVIPGLISVHERLGRMDLSDLLAPAVRLGREGVEVNEAQSYLFEILKPILCRTRYGERLYTRDGRLLGLGENFRMPELSDFLDTLGRESIRFWSQGEAARRLVEWSHSGGGLITGDDLECYEVVVRRPLAVEFASKQVFLNPPPAQSGLLLQLTLALLEALRAEETGCEFGLGDLVRACAFTQELRKKLARIDELKGDQEPLVEHPSYPAWRRQFLDGQEWPGSGQGEGGYGATTHLSILDVEGNAVAVTTTNGSGCGEFVPALGFMLNNMLGEEDLNPGGFHQYRKGARLGSMMAPTIVFDESGPFLVTGSSGSNRIRSALVQILVNVLQKQYSLEEATAAPRFHLEGERLSLEPGFERGDFEVLEEKFQLEFWDRRNLFFGGVNSVSREEAVADLRRSGAALIC